MTERSKRLTYVLGISGISVCCIGVAGAIRAVIFDDVTYTIFFVGLMLFGVIESMTAYLALVLKGE